MGIAERGLEVSARVGFDTLGLQTFLTAGPKESRLGRSGWARCAQAAGVIRSDFQKGHQAEVALDDLVAAGRCRTPVPAASVVEKTMSHRW